MVLMISNLLLIIKIYHNEENNMLKANSSNFCKYVDNFRIIKCLYEIKIGVLNLLLDS